MFTFRPSFSPKILLKTPDMSPGFKKEGWPYTVDVASDTSHNRELNQIEQVRQERTMRPLLSVVANQQPEEYHEIARLVQQKLEQVIHLANTTEYIIDGTKVTLLAILAESTIRGCGSYSITGHELVKTVRDFALTELTPTKLKRL